MGAPAELHRARQFLQQGQSAQARQCLETLLQAQPDHLLALNELGLLLRDQSQFAQAQTLFMRLLALLPNDIAVCNNLGWVLRKQAKWVEAMLAFRACIAMQPDFAGAHANLALVLLQLGDYEQGWREYEYRLIESPQLRPQLPFPHWQGLAQQPPAGKRMLLVSEQGLGDMIQFSRYACLLSRLGALVDVLTSQPLVALFTTLPGVRRVAHQLEVAPDEYDYQCQIMSLPYLCNTRLGNVPATVPYLFAAPQKVAYWQQRLQAHAATLLSTRAAQPPLTSRRPLRVGLVWAGGVRANDAQACAIDERRSLTIASLIDILRLPHIQFVSLQKGPPAAQLRNHATPELQAIFDACDACLDFSDTAALIENLDLVISCDTSVAHLAGALAKPVWILNRYDLCWRWLTQRTDSPWYPSARLFTQTEPGQWQPVLDAVKRALLEVSAPRA